MKEAFLKTLAATLATGIAGMILEELKEVVAAKKKQRQELIEKLNSQQQSRLIPNNSNKKLN